MWGDTGRVWPACTPDTRSLLCSRHASLRLWAVRLMMSRCQCCGLPPCYGLELWITLSWNDSGPLVARPTKSHRCSNNRRKRGALYLTHTRERLSFACLTWRCTNTRRKADDGTRKDTGAGITNSEKTIFRRKLPKIIDKPTNHSCLCRILTVMM